MPAPRPGIFLLHWDFGGQKIKPLPRWGLIGHSTHPVPCCSCLGVVGVGPLGLLFPKIFSSSTHDSCVQGSPSNVTGADLGSHTSFPSPGSGLCCCGLLTQALLGCRSSPSSLDCAPEGERWPLLARTWLSTRLTPSRRKATFHCQSRHSRAHLQHFPS